MPFPRNADQLSESWCISRLVEASVLSSDATVSDFRVTAFHREASFRSELTRIAFKHRDGRDWKSFSCICKFAPRSGSIRDHAVYIFQKNSKKETNFYRHCAQELLDISPAAYYAAQHTRTGQMCLLLEELDYVRYSENDRFSLETAHRALSAMARLHSHHWGLTRHSIKWTKKIDPMTIDFFGSLCRGPYASVLKKVLLACWHQGLSDPVTLVHGDARIGNLLFSRDSERAVLIDWQAARIHRSAWDVVYFLVLSLPTDTRKKYSEELIQYYYDCLCRYGVTGFSKEKLDEDILYAGFLLVAFGVVPMLVIEASVAKQNSAVFLDSILIPWRERASAWMAEHDLEWMSSRIGESEQTLRDAFEHEWRYGISIRMINRFRRYAGETPATASADDRG